MKCHFTVIRSAMIAPLLALLAATAFARAVYVDSRARGANDGSSWGNACVALQDALADANEMEKPVEIWVAQGTYRPDQGAGVKAGDTNATFRLINGVTIRGGYAGLTQPDPNAWDPNEYETILYGDLQGNDDFQDSATLSDNSLHVVTSIGVDQTAVLEGVTIAHGAFLGRFVFDGENPPQGGAGLYNEAGSPRVRWCVFTENYAILFTLPTGSGVFAYNGGSPHFEGCTFEGNRKGAAFASHGSSSVLQDCRFVDNLSPAVTLTESVCEMDGCLFRGNNSAALWIYDTSQAALTDCVFRENKRGIYRGRVECTRCTFERNASDSSSGAVSVDEGTFVDCVFRGSSGKSAGVVSAMSLQMTRCAIVQNRTTYGPVGCRRGALDHCLFAGNQTDEGPGVVGVSTGGTLSNCTFVGNRAKSLRVLDAMYITEPLILSNCIFRDNVSLDASEPVTIVGSPLMVIEYSNIGSIPAMWLNGATMTANIDVDPLFADRGHWDPNGTPEDPNDDFFVEGDYHLKSQAGRWDPNSQDWVLDDVTSPCIDAGDPNDPVGDEPFPNGNRINMGAYGGTAEASKSYREGRQGGN